MTTNPDNTNENFERPLTPLEIQTEKNFVELDTLFNRQVLESSRAFLYGAYAGGFAGFLQSFRFKRPLAIGMLSGGFATQTFNSTKFGPWYWWCFENWNEKNKRVMDSLKGQDEIKKSVPSYLAPYGPKSDNQVDIQFLRSYVQSESYNQQTTLI